MKSSALNQLKAQFKSAPKAIKHTRVQITRSKIDPSDPRWANRINLHCTAAKGAAPIKGGGNVAFSSFSGVAK